MSIEIEKNTARKPSNSMEGKFSPVPVEVADGVQSESTWDSANRAYFKRKYRRERWIGTLLLIPASPIIFLLCLIVRLNSKGSGLYKQTRIGLHGQHYEILKLRTMRNDAEADGNEKWCVKGDPRITRLGKWLRKLHLDELPQLINVARGEMALVGPRPERPKFVEKLKREVPGYENRLSVMPGITGLAQINLPPDETIEDVRRKLYLDLVYIEEAGFWLDMRMILATSVRLIGVPGTVVTKLLGLHRKIYLPEEVNFAETTPSATSSVAEMSSTKVRRPEAKSARVDKASSFDSSMAESPRKRLNNEWANAFTVDVEDYFQVTAFEERVSRKSWSQYDSRVVMNTRRLLRLMDRFSVRGTFFILGWVAERFPGLVREIQSGGHEIASHGYWHHLIYDQTPEEFEKDVRASQEAICDACGVVPTAYRAPSFSIVQGTQWALDILISLGFTVDSSIFPISGHDRYGIPGAKKEIHVIHRSEGSILEYPPSAWHVGKWNVPIGGGYFRILPFQMTRKSIAMVNRAGRPAMFYIHPWELDAQQPPVRQVGWKSNLRHYTGLKRSEVRLEKLLRQFSFTTMSDSIHQWEQRARIERCVESSRVHPGKDSQILEGAQLS